MKPMIVLFIVGISFSVFLFYLGQSKPDGVVVSKPYESAIKFESDKKDLAGVKDVADNFTVARKDGKVYFSFNLYPERASYDNISIKEVSVAPIMDKPILLRQEGNYFVTDRDLEQGWYNLAISLNADNKTITLQESLHLDKAS